MIQKEGRKKERENEWKVEELSNQIFTMDP
jgi:hypothetical protein